MSKHGGCDIMVAVDRLQHSYGDTDDLSIFGFRRESIWSAVTAERAHRLFSDLVGAGMKNPIGLGP